jgi:hypothetical protein
MRLFLTVAAIFAIGVNAASALPSNPLAKLSSPIVIEQDGFTASISLEYPEAAAPTTLLPAWVDGKMLPFAGILLVMLGLMGWQHRRLQNLEKRAAVAPAPATLDNPFAEAVTHLCDRNQLKRLSAIHHIGQVGLAQADYRQRAATMLSVYVRAISKDASLRKKASAEILAVLEEISQLNAAAKASKSMLRLNLEGCNFSGLVLQDLDLRGASLAKSTLVDTTFRKVNLSDADVSGAIISESRFDSVDATRLIIKGTIWRKVSVSSNVKGLTQDDVLIAEKASPEVTPFPANSDVAPSKQASIITPSRKELFLNPDMPSILDKTKLH